MKVSRPFATLTSIHAANPFFILAFFIPGLFAASASAQNVPDLATPQEKHLRNVRQLTFGGQNAEAHFSADGTKLIFQSSHGEVKCDQIFIMNIDGSDQHMVSTGKGRTTCAYFYPDGKKILFSSTQRQRPARDEHFYCGLGAVEIADR